MSIESNKGLRYEFKRTIEIFISRGLTRKDICDFLKIDTLQYEELKNEGLQNKETKH